MRLQFGPRFEGMLARVYNSSKVKTGALSLSRSQWAFGLVMLGTSVIMAFIGVIFRYVFHVTAFWVYPFQRYSFLMAVFIAAVIASEERIHVRVEISDTLLRKKPKANFILRSTMQFIAFGVCCAFTYLAYDFMVWAWHSGQIDTVLEWFPLGVTKSFPFVLGLLSSIYFGVYLINDIVKELKELIGRGE